MHEMINITMTNVLAARRTETIPSADFSTSSLGRMPRARVFHLPADGLDDAGTNRGAGALR